MFTINITRDGVLLGTVELDGLKLDWKGDQALVGELVADEMGRDAIRECDALPIPEDRS